MGLVYICQARDEREATPLHEAATYNQLNEARLLIEADCDVFVKDKEKITPLHLACMIENADLCELLISNVKKKDKIQVPIFFHII